MARVYLHIGIEKTGTTTLQAFLLANEARLQQRGWTYLCDDGRPYFERIAHGPLAACLIDGSAEFVSARKRASADMVLQALRRDIDAAGRDVILSCEQFSSRITDAAALGRLADALDGHDVRIVCYLRRQDDLAIAAYTTAVRSGRRTPLSAEEVMAGGWYYDFRAMLQLWSGIFGQSALIVRPYDLRELVGRDIRRDVLALLGIEDMSNFVFGADRNISLDARQVEVLRVLNAVLPGIDDARQQDFERGNRLRALIDEHLPRGEPLRALLAADARRSIMDSFAEANREVEARYMGPGALADWFAPIETQNADVVAPAHPLELAAVATAMADQLADATARLEHLESELDRVRRPRRIFKGFVRALRGAPLASLVVALMVNSLTDIAAFGLDNDVLALLLS